MTDKPNKGQEEYESETSAPLHDALTGLCNYGYFHHTLRRELKRAERYGPPCAVALVGLDSLGGYNRRHGYAAGDNRIVQTAKMFSDALRFADLPARFEGDVFAAIMPHTDSAAAAIALDRFRERVAEELGAGSTVSVGLAEIGEDRHAVGPLMDAASAALNRARLEGGNRTVRYSAVEMIPKGENARVLVVDDLAQNRRLLQALLQPRGYEVIMTDNGDDGLSILNRGDIDIVLLDIMMPGIDGFEVCRRIKSNRSTRLVPVVMVTGLDDVDSKVKAIEAGADDFITKPPNRHELLARVSNLVRAKKLNENLTSMEDVLISLANAVEARDEYTEGHVQRVADLAVVTGRRMACTSEQLRALRLGGVLHDIGKLGTPDHILNKPGKLDPSEWDVIKMHPAIGYQICLPLKENLGQALDIVRQHHEKLDGSGYPDGLSEEEICLEARIMAVVDIYDALVTDRAYRKGMDKAKAISILRADVGAGKLDSDVLEHFVEIVGENVP